MKYFVPTGLRVFLIALVIVLSASAVRAADDQHKELGTLNFKFENDLFSGADQNYTNGLRVSWLSPKGDSFRPLQLVRGALEALAQDTNKSTRFGVSMGQELYTPRNRYQTNLIVNERPYAGWVYGGLSLHTVTDKGPGRKDLESIELDVGIVGPLAFGEETQNFIHDLRRIDTFDGWGNQLKNELGAVLHYERKWRLFNPVKTGALEFDAIPHAGISVGNITSQISSGGAVRWGWNLPDNFGPPSLIQGGTTLDRLPEKTISLYLFGAGQGRFVAHSIFLDGNTFRNSHSIDKENWVGDLSLGVALLLGRFKVAYTNAFRSKEFEEQEAISRFGSVSVSFQAFF